MDYYKIDNIDNQHFKNNIEDQYQISINDMLKEINLYFYNKSDKVNIFTDEMLLKKYLKEHNIDYDVNNQGIAYYSDNKNKFINLTPTAIKYTNDKKGDAFIDQTFENYNQGIIFSFSHEIAHHIFGEENEITGKFLYKSDDFKSKEIDLINKLFKSGVSDKYRNGNGNAIYNAGISANEMHSDMLTALIYIMLIKDKNPEKISKVIENMHHIAEKRKERTNKGDQTHQTGISIENFVQKLIYNNYKISLDERSQIIALSTVDILKKNLKNTPDVNLVKGYLIASNLNDKEFEMLNVNKEELLKSDMKNEDILLGYFLRKNNFKYAFQYTSEDILDISKKEASVATHNEYIQKTINESINKNYKQNNQIKDISENTEKISFNVSKTKLLSNIENATRTNPLGNNVVNITKKMNLK
jgi:hypothetical protein